MHLACFGRRAHFKEVRTAIALAGIAVVSLTGCVTAKKYRLAKPDTPPPSTLNWEASAPPVTLTLRAVIVFKGPGSWKREARWDEYAVMITNDGKEPFILTTAELADLRGAPQLPGTDPWMLEKLSYTNWEKYGKTGLKLAAGAVGVAVVGTAAAVAAAGPGFIITSSMVTVATVIPIVAVGDVVIVYSLNQSNREKVEAEFTRRRLVLPLTVEPGATVRGSLFFPMTPGPQRLILRGKVGEAPHEVSLGLKPLAGLHLAPAAIKQ